MATNYKALFWKLQNAFGKYQNRVFRLTQLQVYSEKAGRSVTKYILAEKIDDKYQNVFQSWNYPEVVKYLGELWQATSGAD